MWTGSATVVTTPWIVVHAFEMIFQIPTSWEAVSWHTSLATFVSTKKRLFTMSVQSMSLPFMAKNTCGT